MKALPRPSLTMLWIARVSALYFLAFSLFHLGYYFYASGDWSHSLIKPIDDESVYVYSVAESVKSIVADTIFVASLFFLQLTFARVSLALTAIYHLTFSLISVAPLAYAFLWANYFSNKIVLFFAADILVTIFYALFLYLAIRPPLDSSHTNSNSSSDHLFPLPA